MRFKFRTCARISVTQPLPCSCRYQFTPKNIFPKLSAFIKKAYISLYANVFVSMEITRTMSVSGIRGPKPVKPYWIGFLPLTDEKVT